MSLMQAIAVEGAESNLITDYILRVRTFSIGLFGKLYCTFMNSKNFLLISYLLCKLR